ncbi:hypothetical protein M501DRAFT_905410, partial [Patellaria atrata CBS 101060]
TMARPFPSLEGGCFCGETRYRMAGAPLFVHACHCHSCQQETGSCFSLHAIIEPDRIISIGKVMPVYIRSRKESAKGRLDSMCPKCNIMLWSRNTQWPTLDLKVGTLDVPDLMPPDMHIYVGSKVSWLELPKDAKVEMGHYDWMKVWPKSSLKRLEIATVRAKE